MTQNRLSELDRINNIERQLFNKIIDKDIL